MSWHKSIFGYKLRTDLRTIEAENSEGVKE